MRFSSAFILVLLSVFSLSTYSLEQKSEIPPNIDSTLASSLIKLGEGQMSILFWKVYKAEFYSTDAPYNESAYPKALKLTYQRDIEKQEFVDATQDQWIKLNAHFSERLVSEEQEALWLKQLSDIFPDIQEKDIILFTLSKNKQANFYLKKHNKSNKELNNTAERLTIKNYQLLGSITEPAFGDYFLSIWLSKYTTEPKLRKKLIGE